MFTLKKHGVNAVKYFARQKRDPRYIFILIVSLLVFTICYMQVRNTGLFDSVERPIFQFFNMLPSFFKDFMFGMTQMGGLASLAVWLPLAWYLVNRRAAFLTLLSSFLAWFLAKEFKLLAHRGRPGDLLHAPRLFDNEVFGGFGFPSGHSTVAAACATVLYYQVGAKYRKYLTLIALGVGISRMYLGAHFPLDVVGGWALGAFIGSGIAMVAGVSTRGLSSRKIKSYLIKHGLPVASLRSASVDARGSRPLFITTEDGKEYFGKVFGKQEHAADWLFKMYRFFRFKNLQAEEPHISSRRNVEGEALAMLWAKQSGIRVSRLIDVYKYGSSWISVQEKIDAVPLSELSKIRPALLEDVWKQVRKLHIAKIAHRDLRAANVMVDKKGQAWIIDFGFSELAASNQRIAMDNAELLMSMSLVAGVPATIKAAKKGIGSDALRRAVPYLQKSVFSGATTKLLRKNRTLLGELKTAIAAELGIAKEDINEVNILRISKQKALNMLLLTVFIYIIAPQFSTFKNAISSTHITSVYWLLPLTVASFMTYVFTGFIYVALANVPLRLRDATLVQLAASFISKIIPSGIGGTTLNAKYMNKAGMEAYETTAVISTQAALGFVMFIVPLGLFLVLNGTSILKLVHFHIPGSVLVAILIAVLVAVVCIALIDRIRKYLKRMFMTVIESLRDIATSPRELAMACAASLAVTAAYVFCLYTALQSLGLHIGISGAILVYATAVIAKSAIPAPGGLGPVEAAMIATLIGLGIPQQAAISSVLIYRLATFWIPIPFSLIAYRYIAKRKLI